MKQEQAKICFVPQVFRYRDEDNAMRCALVFRRGRTLYHAVVATHNAIKIKTFQALSDLVPSRILDGVDYPVRRAASFWLNHDHRPITTRARAVLRGLVARKPGLVARKPGLVARKPKSLDSSSANS